MTSGSRVTTKGCNAVGPQGSPATRYLCLVVLMAATLIVYSPVKQYPFINLDDQPYVVHNAKIQQLNWETVKWSFTTFHSANWHPLTWLSHAIDYHFFALDAGRHHETNLLLHTMNAMLLFWVLAKATGYSGRSLAVAAVCAASHQCRVGRVDRRTQESAQPAVLSAGARRLSLVCEPAHVGRYLCVAFLFALGLMSKSQVITLPFVLLLWDYWPLGRVLRGGDVSAAVPEAAEVIPAKRLSWLVLEKLPLLGLAAASAVITMKAQIAGGTTGGAVNTFSFGARLGNAILAYLRYLWAAIWPTHLAFFYPHARVSPPAWQVAERLPCCC